MGIKSLCASNNINVVSAVHFNLLITIFSLSDQKMVVCTLWWIHYSYVSCSSTSRILPGWMTKTPDLKLDVGTGEATWWALGLMEGYKTVYLKNHLSRDLGWGHSQQSHSKSCHIFLPFKCLHDKGLDKWLLLWDVWTWHLFSVRRGGRECLSLQQMSVFSHVALFFLWLQITSINEIFINMFITNDSVILIKCTISASH